MLRQRAPKALVRHGVVQGDHGPCVEIALDDVDAVAEGCRPLGQELVPRMVGIVCWTAAEMPLETWSVFGFAVDRLLVLVVDIENFFCIESQMD